MSQLDAFTLTNKVRQRLVDFALNTNFARGERLNEICRRLWAGSPETGGLVSDLWVEGAFPSETAAETLDSLTRQGKFNATLARHLDERDAAPRHRQLYRHQHEAILAAQESHSGGARPALVVTAGTGAGKTESFLLPALNELWETPRAPGAGVRCLILYPMNALVNDQVDRLYNWLIGQTRLTLFHFTSETPENDKAADREGIPKWEPCRLRTRQEARRNPPDILITNYSMLEYMLCRPQDAVFFGDGLRVVVLDEAHLYTGTLAAEITLLLRRLLDRCRLRSEQVLQLATSATIGGGAEGELESFASQLFSKEQSLVRVIRGQARRADLPPPAPPVTGASVSEISSRRWLRAATLNAEANGELSLASNPDQCDELADDLRLLVAPEIIANAVNNVGNKPALLLRQALAHSPLLHRVENILWERGRLPLRELAKELWQSSDDAAVRATIALLQMGAAARAQANDYPLLPHRLHLLARPTDGLVVCLNSSCAGDEALKLAGAGCVTGGYSDHCPHCDGATLALHRCFNCGEAALAGTNVDRRLLPVGAYDFSNRKSLFSLQPCNESQPKTIDPATGQLRGFGFNGLTVYPLNKCPRCGGEIWQPFVSPSELTLTILAESALAELPEYPASHRDLLPARGRRMLAFSDSRQEAARLGPRLTLQHEIQLVHAALARCAQSGAPVDAASQEFLLEEIANYEKRLQQPNLTAATRQTIQARLDESRLRLRAQAAGGSIDDWCKKLAEEPAIKQLMDADAASAHSAADWPARAHQHWEENARAIERRLRLLIGRELAKPIRQSASVETLGLLEVTYPELSQIPPPSMFLGSLPDDSVRQAFAECWTDFLAALCDSLRRDGAITLGSREEDQAYPFGGELVRRWCAESTTTGAYLVQMLSRRRLRFAAAVLRNCGLPEDRIEEAARDILRIAFQALRERAEALPWLLMEFRPLKQGGSVPALQINFPQLGLRSPTELFRCELTGHIWPRSVRGCAPEENCDRLRPVSSEELDRDPRVGRQRSELKSSPVFDIGLWAEEHSAQLSAKENRRLQDLFKVGARNILSSTTTLELGIDIGGLNAVLMSNAPPGKANYLQRAGRAGRRADGSSVVITYTRLRPFDREVFRRFGDYLGRPLRRPRVLLERPRVVRRHAHAFLLGEFFQVVYPPGAHVGAMNAFGNMGRFCGEALPRKWNRGEEKPELRTPSPNWQPSAETPWWDPTRQDAGLEDRFLDFLRWTRDYGEDVYRPRVEAFFEGTPMRKLPDGWRSLLDLVISLFTTAVKSWREDYKTMRDAWETISETMPQARAQANMLRYQMSALYEMTVIEALADRQFLPRYGFPIGLQKLRVIAPSEDGERTRIREEDQFRLERPGLLALGEYVPGSQLLVGGKLITSRGLLKHWTGAALDTYIGLRGHYTTCRNKHFYYEIAQPLTVCPLCDQPSHQSRRDLLLPKHGFSSAAWDAPRRSVEVERVGRVERATISFARREQDTDQKRQNYAGVVGLFAHYREDGELLVYNEGASQRHDEDADDPQATEGGKGFAICLKCGYAESERKFGQGRLGLSSNFLQHAPLTAISKYSVCWGDHEAPVLRNQTLAARETTDILLLAFYGERANLAESESLAETLGRALQIAGARLLELDTRELGVMTTDTAEGYGAVLYDNTPGGAGHVRELLELERNWLEAALNALYLNEDHDRRCETACLDCLLTFDAQEAMSQGLLKRKETYEVLSKLLAGVPLSLPEPQKTIEQEFPDSAAQASVTERIKRNQQRLRQR